MDCCGKELITPFCPFCGAENKDERSECPKCGGVLVNTAFRYAKVFSDFKCDSCKKEFRIIEIKDTTRIIEY